MDDSYHGLFVPYPRTFRTVVRILVSSTFLSRVSKVAIKVVCLQREHRARLLKRTNAKDDHDAAADAMQMPTTMTTTQSPKRRRRRRRRQRRRRHSTTPAMTTTTQMPYQRLQQYILCRRFNLSPFWLSYIIFDAVFVCRRIESLRRYEKSEDGTKSPWYESSMVRKVHRWYETSMVRKVYGTKSLVPIFIVSVS